MLPHHAPTGEDSKEVLGAVGVDAVSLAHNGRRPGPSRGAGRTFGAGGSNGEGRAALKFGSGPCALMDRLGAAEVERILAPVLEDFAIARPAALARVGNLLA